MEKSNLPDNPGKKKNTKVNLPFYREKLISILNECYTKDIIEMEELEGRLEKVHNAKNLKELENYIDDLPIEFKQQYYNTQPAAIHASNQITPIEKKYKVIMGEKILRGASLENSRTKVVVVMGECIVDLSNTPLPNKKTEISITCVMGEIKVIVPTNAIINTEFTTIMASHKEDKSVNANTSSDSPIITLTGKVIMGEINIQTE